MTTPTCISMAVAGFFFAAASSHAAIVINDLSGLPTLSPTNPSVTGITVAPIGEFAGWDSSLSEACTVSSMQFIIREDGTFSIGVGKTVPLGTDLASYAISPGIQLTSDETLPTDRYFAAEPATNLLGALGALVLLRRRH